MKVSVIMPTFNGVTRHGFLLEAINSFKAQKGDKELIIVNDGSTDNTLDVIHEQETDEIKVITQTNRGQGYAENTGIFAATGDLITLLDDDDLLPEGSLIKRAEAFTDGIDCVIGRYSEKFGGELKTKEKPEDESVLKKAIWYIPGIVASQSLMWRKSLHDKIGYFNKLLSSCEDYEWKIRVIMESNIKLIDYFVYTYRYHSEMRSDKHRRAGVLQENKARVLDALKEKYEDSIL